MKFSCQIVSIAQNLFTGSRFLCILNKQFGHYTLPRVDWCPCSDWSVCPYFVMVFLNSVTMVCLNHLDPDGRMSVKTLVTGQQWSCNALSVLRFWKTIEAGYIANREVEISNLYVYVDQYECFPSVCSRDLVHYPYTYTYKSAISCKSQPPYYYSIMAHGIGWKYPVNKTHFNGQTSPTIPRAAWQPKGPPVGVQMV